MQGSDGLLYGTTQYGGTNGLGTVFKISTNGALTTLYSFGVETNEDGFALDGASPEAGLVQGSDGSFYGTTSAGGNEDTGTVFKISGNGSLTSLYSFDNYVDDGRIPSSGLVQGSDGNFYGTTAQGGTSSWSFQNMHFDGYGTVFKISTNGVLTSLYSFNYGSDVGFYPLAGLVVGHDGSLYGTTSGGGQGGAGTVFRLTIVPEFQALTVANGTLNLTWSTEAGGTYQLQYNSDLTSTNWINLGNPIPATASTLTATDALTNGPQRFYRLMH